MIAKRIKKYLDDNGIKQNFLAQKTGMTDCVISDIFNRGRKIEVSEYYRICKALNVPFELFIEGDEELTES